MSPLRLTSCSLALLVPVLLGQSAVAAEPTVVPITQRTARNVIYGEVATGIVVGAISVNYERMVNDWLSLRAGIGAAVSPDLHFNFCFDFSGTGCTEDGSGPQDDVHFSGGFTFMANFLVGSESPWMLELGVGASLMFGKGQLFDLEADVNVAPAASISARYQPLDGGFFFRGGLLWTYGVGLPIGFSFGSAF